MKQWFSEVKEKYYGIDGVLVAVGLIVLLVAFYFFFQDDGLGASVAGREIKPVGTFTSSRNDVRRRIQSGFTWSSVGNTDTVYEGDSVFTGDESDAAIELTGGSQLKIDPKSLVVVKTTGGGLQLDLQYGSLVGKVKDDSPIVIVQNGQLQRLTSNDAEIRIEAVEGKDTKIQVMRGEVELKPVSKKSKQKAQTVRVNEVVEFKAKQEPVVRKISVSLLAPANGKMLWLPLGKTINFQWKLTNAEKSVKNRVQLSRDVNFETIMHSADVAGFSYLLPEDKRPGGTFHWRVQALAANGNVEAAPSASSILTVFPDVPPLPTFPSFGQEFAFNPVLKEANKQVTLSWEDDAGSTEFAVQIAQDEPFTKLLVDKKITALNERTPPLAAGRYFWRVRGLHAQRANAPSSRTMMFVVEEEAKEPLAPKLLQAKLDYEIPATLLARTPGASMNGRGITPENLTPFRWTETKDVENYEVEVAPTETFENSIKQDLGKQTLFALREVKPGSVFVRVRAKGRKGLISPPSETGRLTVQLPAPDLKPIAEQVDRFKTLEELGKGKHDFKMSWSPVPFAESYELEWGTDKSFLQSKKFRLKSTERSITVTKSMDYTARVRALGDEGTPLGPYSSVQTASYKKEFYIPPPPVVAPVVKAPRVAAKSARETASVNKFALPTPALQEPLRNTQVVSLEDSVSYVNFKWRRANGAEYYEVQLSEDADFSRVISTSVARTTNFTMQKSLPEGRVFWRVRARAKGGLLSDWSPVYDLNVLYQ